MIACAAMSSGRKVVWITGAGFSKALGAPLLADLLSVPAANRLGYVYPEIAARLNFERVATLYEAGAYGARGADCQERQWEHAEEFLELLDLSARLGDGAPVAANLRSFAARTNRVVLDETRAQPSLEPYAAERLREAALRMMAAECCSFLEGANVESERWKPYLRWARTLQPEDVVLTFNVDRVPNLLGRLYVPSPEDLRRNRRPGVLTNCASVLKLHGSVDWVKLEDGTIARAEALQEYSGPPEVAALRGAVSQLALATPGPTKQAMVSDSNGLGLLWQAARHAIRNADTVVFVGYRVPPSDAYTREWLIDALRENEKCKEAGGKHPPLRVITVLGADVNSHDSQRLRGLMKAIRGIAVEAQPMWAEDFLAVHDRDAL